MSASETPRIFLKEGGITISTKGLFVPGRAFDFANIVSVWVVRLPYAPGKITFRLMLSDQSGEHMVTETSDQDLLARIMRAMDEAASAYRDKKGSPPEP